MTWEISPNSIGAVLAQAKTGERKAAEQKSATEDSRREAGARF